jgi:K+ transporter
MEENNILNKTIQVYQEYGVFDVKETDVILDDPTVDMQLRTHLHKENIIDLNFIYNDLPFVINTKKIKIQLYTDEYIKLKHEFKTKNFEMFLTICEQKNIDIETKQLIWNIQISYNKQIKNLENNYDAIINLDKFYDKFLCLIILYSLSVYTKTEFVNHLNVLFISISNFNNIYFKSPNPHK